MERANKMRSLTKDTHSPLKLTRSLHVSVSLKVRGLVSSFCKRTTSSFPDNREGQQRYHRVTACRWNKLWEMHLISRNFFVKWLEAADPRQAHRVPVVPVLKQLRALADTFCQIDATFQ